MNNKAYEYINTKKVLQSNTSGPFIIIDYNEDYDKYLIRFINTGYEKYANYNNLINGRVLDKSLNGKISKDYNIYRYQNYDKIIYNTLLNIYNHMIDRCYNKKCSKYKNYGAIGITVTDRWINNKDLFIKDCESLFQYNKFYNNPFLYQFDKDYLQQNIPKEKRIYSPETCVFLYYKDNSNLKIIENHNINTYYGVEFTKFNHWYARIKINGNRINIGTFNNPIAAANAYNYWVLHFHDFELVPLLNNVPYMAPDEFIKYNINKKEMCKIIK